MPVGSRLGGRQRFPTRVIFTICYSRPYVVPTCSKMHKCSDDWKHLFVLYYSSVRVGLLVFTIIYPPSQLVFSSTQLSYLLLFIEIIDGPNHNPAPVLSPYFTTYPSLITDITIFLAISGDIKKTWYIPFENSYDA